MRRALALLLILPFLLVLATPWQASGLSSRAVLRNGVMGGCLMLEEGLS